MKYQDHIYHSEKIESILADIICFFESTPILKLVELKEAFPGAGIYALYYTGKLEVYAAYSPALPIYIGKAVPRGWRQGRCIADEGANIFSRLREHARNIETVKNLDLKDFLCRFTIMASVGADLISALESALIRKYRPLWNSVVDGFGIHDPGGGRKGQKPSEWDTIHPGRYFAERLTGERHDVARIDQKIKNHILGL